VIAPGQAPGERPTPAPALVVPIDAVVGNLFPWGRQPREGGTMATSKKGGMSVSDAGRKGGERVAQQRGRAFYEEIGKKGGRTVARERGHDFYEEIGRKGGEAVKASRGHDFFSSIGHKGGQRVRELIRQARERSASRPGTPGASEGPHR
jgi:general stress protein YciG